MPIFERSSQMPVSAAELDRWHARPGAFERLVAPWTRVKVLESDEGIDNGARTVLELGRPPFSVRWVAVHQDRVPGRGFTDVQKSGPFRRWAHEHRFTDLPPGGSRLTDRVDYELPLGPVGALAEGAVRRRLERVFAYRHAVTREDLARHAPYGGLPSLKVAVSGATGLIGGALTAFLSAAGHEVRPIPRGVFEPEVLDGVDAVVHLAGAGIADRRWSASRMREIRDSRVLGTSRLAEALVRLPRKPGVLVTASAVGYYGPRGDEVVDESSGRGSGFLAEVVDAWEASSEAAARDGVRTAALRFGIVLTPSGGALAKMLPAFRLGLGGPVGSGRQGFSWIALDDVLYAIHHAIRTPVLSGPINVVAPNPVSQRVFARALGRALGRPAALPVPGVAIKAVFGRMGEEALLAGQFVSSRRLVESGFRFAHPELDSALAAMLP